MHYLLDCGGKKGDLLKASIELFAAKGYDGVSVRDIAKVAGVSEAALYKHFTGKEDMALYIFTAIITEYTQRVLRIKEKQIACLEKLCEIVETTYSLYEEYPAEIRFVLLSQYNFWDRVSEDIKPHFLFRNILTEGMAAEEIPKQDVYFLLTVFSGVMLQPLVQYPYFHDVLPPIDGLSSMITAIVRKLFTR
jgi:AcrR family transcriptional regulator